METKETIKICNNNTEVIKTMTLGKPFLISDTVQSLVLYHSKVPVEGYMYLSKALKSTTSLTDLLLRCTHTKLEKLSTEYQISMYR